MPKSQILPRARASATGWGRALRSLGVAGSAFVLFVSFVVNLPAQIRVITAEQEIADALLVPIRADGSPTEGQLWLSTTTADALKYRGAATTFTLATTADLSGGYQPLDATLTALAALTIADGSLIYGTGADAFATVSSTSWGRALLNLADAAAARTYLGLVIGTDVQAYDADLTAWAAVNPSTWTGSTSLTTLGTISAGTWQGSVIGSAYGGAGTVNGLLKADGAGLVSAATAGTDYEVPLTFSTGLTRSTNTVTVNIGTDVQAYDADLASIAANTTGGFLTRTASNTYTPRTITGTSDQVVVSNGDGVAGAPTLSLPQSIGTSSGVQFARLGLGQAPDATGALSMLGSGASTPIAGWINAGAPNIRNFTEGGIGNGDIMIAHASDTGNSRPVLIGRRARGTLAAPTTVSISDQMFSFLGSAYDGTNFLNNAEITIYVDGTVSTGVMPMGIDFFTAGNSGGRLNRMRIRGEGRLDIGATSRSMTAWSTTGSHLRLSSITITDSTSSGTVAAAVGSSFGAPTYAASSSTTFTNAANVYIEGDVAAGTNVTLTNTYGLWNVGKTRLNGAVMLGVGSSTALGRAPAILYQSTTAVGNITTGVDDLITQAIAANTLATNGDRLRITAIVSLAANANSKQIIARYGGTTCYDSTAQVANAGTLWIEVLITRTGAATQNISARVNSSNALFDHTANHTTATETLSGSVTFKLTGEAVDTDDIIQRSLLVEYLPAP